MKTRRVRAIRIHCPVEAGTHRALIAGDTAALNRDPVAGPMLAIIGANEVLGTFGLYRGVVEIGVNFERFTPTGAAVPATGTAGATSTVPSVTLRTYVADEADAAQVEAAIDALMAAHPWEVPVIEFGETALLLR